MRITTRRATGPGCATRVTRRGSGQAHLVSAPPPPDLTGPAERSAQPAHAPPPGARPWRAAATEALYGPTGFYHRPEGPAGHFRTAVTRSALFAEAVLRLAHEVDAALGGPEPFDLVDVGAGRGELLRTLLALGVPDRWRLTGVDLAARPADLPTRVRWTEQVPRLTGLLVAHEWLDDVPADVVEVTEQGPRLVLVDGAGREFPVGEPTPRDLAWLETWWPLEDALPGDRGEVGHPRDDAWLVAVDAVRRGLAVAVDYGHRLGARPRHGTLTGYREGRVVPPVPDGSCDLTTSVALDACAAAGVASGADTTLLTTQRLALGALGIDGSRPPRSLAVANPTAYRAALQHAGEAAALLDPAGPGRFDWLVQTVGCPLPAALDGLPAGPDTDRDLALPHED